MPRWRQPPSERRTASLRLRFALLATFAVGCHGSDETPSVAAAAEVNFLIITSTDAAADLMTRTLSGHAEIGADRELMRGPGHDKKDKAANEKLLTQAYGSSKRPRKRVQGFSAVGVHQWGGKAKAFEAHHPKVIFVWPKNRARWLVERQQETAELKVRGANAYPGMDDTNVKRVKVLDGVAFDRKLMRLKEEVDEATTEYKFFPHLTLPYEEMLPTSPCSAAHWKSVAAFLGVHSVNKSAAAAHARKWAPLEESVSNWEAISAYMKSKMQFRPYLSMSLHEAEEAGRGNCARTAVETLAPTPKPSLLKRAVTPPPTPPPTPLSSSFCSGIDHVGRKNFVIVTSQRSGSRWMMDMLRSHPAVQAGMELLHNSKPLVNLPRSQAGSIVHRFYMGPKKRTNETARGFKAVGIYQWGGVADMFVRCKAKVIFLWRKNLLRKMASNEANHATKNAHPVTAAEIAAVRNVKVTIPTGELFASQMEFWKSEKAAASAQFGHLPHIHVDYEDLVATSPGCAARWKQIQEFIGIEPRDLNTMFASIHQAKPLKETVSNWNELVAFVSQNEEYKPLLDIVKEEESQAHNHPIAACGAKPVAARVSTKTVVGDHNGATGMSARGR